MSEKPTTAEKVMGNLPVSLAVTALAAALPYVQSEAGIAAVAAASLLPPLFNSVPDQRYKMRQDEWRNNVSQDLEKVPSQIASLTDDQYHLMNEIVGIASQTINTTKLEYLRTAVLNTVFMQDLASQEASLLGRLIRDISAHEANFVLEHFGYDYVLVGSSSSSWINSFCVEENSDASLVVRGLAGLGLLVAVDDGNQMGFFGQGTFFTFSKMAGKLIVLLRQS
jgi:hypothetical protein